MVDAVSFHRQRTLIVEITYFYFTLFSNAKLAATLKRSLPSKDSEKATEVDKGKLLVTCYLYRVVLITEGNFSSSS